MRIVAFGLKGFDGFGENLVAIRVVDAGSDKIAECNHAGDVVGSFFVNTEELENAVDSGVFSFYEIKAGALDVFCFIQIQICCDLFCGFFYEAVCIGMCLCGRKSCAILTDSADIIE